MDALRRLGREHGYVPEDVRQSYGGWTVRFVYESVRDARASIKADVNFIMRVPLYGVETLPLPEVFDLGGARAPCLLLEDAYGGKLKAMVVRAEPRDVFDVANLLSSGKVYDEARLRKAFLFYAFLDDASLLTVDLDAIRTIIPLDYSRRLYPVLRRAERPDPDAMVDLVLPHVERMLQLTENERAFSQRLGSGRFEPDLLFRGVQVAEDIHHHPGGEWRRRNPHGRMQRDP